LHCFFSLALATVIKPMNHAKLTLWVLVGSKPPRPCYCSGCQTDSTSHTWIKTTLSTKYIELLMQNKALRCSKSLRPFLPHMLHRWLIDSICFILGEFFCTQHFRMNLTHVCMLNVCLPTLNPPFFSILLMYDKNTVLLYVLSIWLFITFSSWFIIYQAK
jgi:hypothetical protein